VTPWISDAITDALSDRFTMTELCERYGVSRRIGYKWLARFTEEGKRTYSRANAASNATCDGGKFVALIVAHASRAPNSRSIPPSSHSIDNGPA
jgi:transposase-like protein